MIIRNIRSKKYEEGKMDEVEGKGTVGYAADEAHRRMLSGDSEMVSGKQQTDDKDANRNPNEIAL